MSTDTCFLIRTKSNLHLDEQIEKLKKFVPEEVINASNVFAEFMSCDCSCFKIKREAKPRLVKWQDAKQVNKLSSLDNCLKFGDWFFLFKGKDSLLVYHPLNFVYLFEDEAIKKSFINAAKALKAFFNSSEVAIFSDWHSIYRNFFEGMRYRECLRNIRESEKEVNDLRKIFIVLERDYVYDLQGFYRIADKKHP